MRLSARFGFWGVLRFGLFFYHSIPMNQCKYGKRPVCVQAVLTHLARLNDISPTKPGTNVIVAIVSTQSAIAGAMQLAHFYGTRIDIVANEDEVALKIAGHISGKEFLRMREITDTLGSLRTYFPSRKISAGGAPWLFCKP